MGVASDIFYCMGCNYRSALPRPNELKRYLLNDGRQIHCPSTIGWCYECADIVFIEALTVAWLEQERTTKIAEQASAQACIDAINSSWLPKKFNAKKLRIAQDKLNWRQSELAHLDDLQGILATRQSKPRCQQCGSENTVPVAFNEDDRLSHGFLHSCGAMLAQSPDGGDCHITWAPTLRLVDTEGRLIEVREREEESKVSEENQKIIDDLLARSNLQ